MAHFLQIRLLHRDGLSIRAISNRLGHGRATVRKALLSATPVPYTRTAPASCPKLGEFIGRIEQILVEDQSAPRKQRHTASRLFQRLRDEHGYQGGSFGAERRLNGHHPSAENINSLAADPGIGSLPE